MAKRRDHSGYERLVDSTENDIPAASFFETRKNRASQFLDVQKDTEDCGLTDTENMEGSDCEASEPEVELELREFLMSAQETVSQIKDNSKSVQILLQVPEDQDNPVTDNEDLTDSLDSEPEIESSQNVLPRLSIRSKRSVLKKLHQAGAYEQSTSALTDVESLSDSDNEKLERGTEARNLTSSDSEMTEGEVLSMSDSDPESIQNYLAQSRTHRYKNNPSSSSAIRGSLTDSDDILVSDLEDLPSWVSKSLPINKQNLVYLIPEVDEGLTDFEDMSQASGEDEQVIEESEFDVHGAETVFQEKQIHKEQGNLKDPDTDEEEGSGHESEGDGKEPVPTFTAIDSGEGIVRVGESYNPSNLISPKKRAVHIEVNNFDEETNLGSDSDSSNDPDMPSGDFKATDSEYHTGSEEEDEKVSLSEFLTIKGGGDGSTRVQTGTSRAFKLRPKFRKRRTQSKKPDSL